MQALADVAGRVWLSFATMYPSCFQFPGDDQPQSGQPIGGCSPRLTGTASRAGQED